MMIKKLTVLAIAASVTFTAMSGAATAAGTSSDYVDEVESCVAEIGRHANYDGATRVRHTVLVVRESHRRYQFRIGTSVFTDSNDIAERQYTAYCVARSNGTPLRFRIEESSV